MKAMYITDIHLKTKNPLRRVDSYKETVLNNVTEACKIAKKKKVDFIICGGDVFDSPIVSNILLDEFADIVESCGVDWYIVPGNHDLIGQNWENSNSSSLAHLIRRSKQAKLLEEIEQDNVNIVGYPYYYGVEKALKKEGLKKPNDKYSIAVVHAMIVPKEISFLTNTTCIEKLECDYDLVLVGHNHEPHGKMVKNGTTYIFAGCFGRRKINEKDTVPTVYIVDTEEGKVEPVEIQTEKEVFDLEGYEEDKSYEKDIENFVSGLKETKVEGGNIKEVVEEVCEDKKVKDLIFDKMKEYEEKNE